MNETETTPSQTPIPPKKHKPAYSVPECKIVKIRDCPWPASLVDTPERAHECWKANVESADWYRSMQECMVTFCLSTRRRLIGFHLTSMGTLDTIFTHPREVFMAAIVQGAAAIIINHNHPSGDPTPSEADIKVTRDLIRAGQLLKIEVLDHVIHGQPSPERPQAWCSLRELGYFYS